MKYIIVSISGGADQTSEELGEKTPFELAKIPNLNALARHGRVGEVTLTSNRLEPSSDVTLLNLLGYQADKFYTGQGPLEAANLELSLEENEIAFRMNLITEAEGRIADATAGNIATKEAKALINFLNKKLSSEFVRFFSGSFYRHIAVIKDAHGYEALSAKTTSPNSIVGELMEDYFPQGPGDELLKKLMFDARLLLQDHEINQVRVDLQENPANMVWLWGQGQTPRLESFSEKFGVSGSLITSREYAKGIARLSHLTAIEIPAPSSEDGALEYQNIANLMISELNEKDFVCLHLDGCDVVSKMGNAKAKISYIEAVDFHILSKVKKYLEEVKEVRVLITPGHRVSWKLREHVRGAVPFVVAGKNTLADDIEQFSETTGNVSDWKVNKGYELIEQFFSKQDARASS